MAEPVREKTTEQHLTELADDLREATISFIGALLQPGVPCLSLFQDPVKELLAIQERLQDWRIELSKKSTQ